MDLIRELAAMTETKTTKVVEEAKEKLDFDELFDKYTRQEKMYSWEGARGVRNLKTLIRILDSHYRDLDDFLEDNSGAIEAIINWINERNVQEWAENLKAEIHEDDEEGEK